MVRLRALILGLLVAVAASPAAAQEAPEIRLELLIQVVQETVRTGSIDRGFFADIAASGDPLYAAPLIDVAYFFPQGPFWEVLSDTLEAVTGEQQLTWRGYFQWAGREDIALPPGYDLFKGLFYATFVDPAFAGFFDGVQEEAQINLAEVVWGGVRVDGIPSLVNARQITPQQATSEGESLFQFCRLSDCSYPAPSELVFGVRLGGDARAYPLRLLNWHEMFNDVIGHTPLLAAPGGEAVCAFRAPTPSGRWRATASCCWWRATPPAAPSGAGSTSERPCWTATRPPSPTRRPTRSRWPSPTVWSAASGGAR